MSFPGPRRYLPRSLYSRAALILLLPVVGIQLVVSVVFIQRLYEDVTAQMTASLALDLRHVVALADAAPDPAAARDAMGPVADDLQLNARLAAAPVAGDRREAFDLSGRLVIETLRDKLGAVDGIDLESQHRRVLLSVPTANGTLAFDIDRRRVSASNPHQLLVLMLVTSLLMTVIAYLFLKNQLRPIKRLADAAEAFGKGRIVPYRPAGATEVRAAGSAFLNMRTRIERQIEQRMLMLSGVSHDLRTPLTRMKLGLSMLDDADAAAMQRDVAEMQAMLDAFLDFAREGSLDDPAEVDPAQLLRDLAENAHRAGQDVTLAACETDGPVQLRPLAVTRALENLIGNAVRYGSRAELSVRASARTIVFTVEDDGPGIEPERRDDAMRPFLRLDAARNQDRGGGVGLGLSIAMDIARQHGGTLRLDRSARLGGLKADLVLAR
ncbi:hypothetical protein OCGS_0378 [Oceaniovalibus guishaninsula JLT2003]|uniref:histidine kinase n=1 Tax=Oceaniovalibus guishaninsula JLT2003 TaxID=1231392 RepID=K2HCY6_9RHOB|nr:ATP-binding protein [Oceaniovalibus guishaninsula]EKE45288.1 hypothetical protein OCGS_0378 [Oceaniovalibus guishaninsula JLT2003]